MSPDIVTQLKDAGIQPSAQRLAVAEYVLATDAHPSADEVLRELGGAIELIPLAA